MAASGATLVEDVAKERGAAPQWFQLYMQPDREATGALLDRCVKAGFKALVLTVDQPVPGWSPRGARTPVIPSPNFRSVNMIGQPIAKTAYDPDRKGLAMFPTNFSDLEWLVQRCAMPVVVKGVLGGDDARGWGGAARCRWWSKACCAATTPGAASIAASKASWCRTMAAAISTPR